MEKVKKKAKIFLCISLALILVSSIVVSAVQTSGWKVTMKELNFETDRGYTMCAYLFIPENATAETPAPGIVTCHGWLNNKEMQDANYVELARRGYVVLAIDEFGHGDSENSPDLNYESVYYGALALSRMPFVDVERIGVTGHSMGGVSSNVAVLYDDGSGTPFISAVLLNCDDVLYYTNPYTGEWWNEFGSRDVGMISAVYDEFFHMRTDEDGTEHQSPDFMDDPRAQSFLYFGVDPTGLENREAYTYYHETIDDKDAIRVIYRPAIIHPWSHFSARSTYSVIEFFENALGAPNPIDPGNQVWQWKEAFNAVGLVGLALFIISFATLMVFTPTFSSLRAPEVVKPAIVKDKKGVAWFWCSLAACSLFGTLIYRWALNVGTEMKVSQFETMGIGLWSTLCGAFTILSMVVYYFAYGKKNGFDLEGTGVKLSLKKLGLTVLLAVIVVTVTYGIVFTADYFFYADFRIWTLAIKAFEAPILKYLPYGLLFILYYVFSSVATNSFNYNQIGGKFNGIICALFAALPAIILPIIQYTTYTSTGLMKWTADAMHFLWLFPIIIILAGTSLISRAIYKNTRNPYLAGIINAIMVTLLTITNTCTYAL